MTREDNAPATTKEQGGEDTDPRSLNGEVARSRVQPGFFQRLAYLFRPQSSATIRENLQDALAADAGDQTITPGERAMLHNILRLREVRVEDVMVPRADVDAVDQTTTLGELLKLFESSGHSRMPVYNETLDDPRGMVHIRDVVAAITRIASEKKRARRKNAPAAAGHNSGAQFDLGKVDLDRSIGELKLARDVLFVPPSMLAADLMGRMQTQRIQMALVIDEYGGTDGLVSLEDIVEMVVGDIEDEHDDDEALFTENEDGAIIADARVELEDLAAALGNGFLEAARSEDDDVDTVGGLIFSLLGRIPVRGEIIASFAGYEIEVLEADPRRIKRVKISRPKRRAPRREAAEREMAAQPPEKSEQAKARASAPAEN
ncbi:hemolysin family protein [Oricola cellulosilytica]|uniref:HlyC/CorC family transporter n=1 Tax=Oricola cellulosilytica TaxID=1429082 RepID=A0A4R0PEU2_9HYPH|nr:hemolysin family protein [Oricola cellulosilytica]TCD16336.1 HlyC/CorC family transporter [Oricola cellulosilytica]